VKCRIAIARASRLASREKGSGDDRRDPVANLSVPGLRWASTLRGNEQDGVDDAVGVPR